MRANSETVSGPQREPDERVREALEFADLFDGSEQNVKFSGMAKAVKQLAAEVRRLQAAQREPVAVIEINGFGPDVLNRLASLPYGTKLYTHPQRDDEDKPHRTMLREEYDALGLKGWHCVCHDYRGEVGSTAVQYAAQRDDHPTEGVLRYQWLQKRLVYGAVQHDNGYQQSVNGATLDDVTRAALAASKGTPDLEHPRPRETAAESLSVDTSVADRKDAARLRFLLDSTSDIDDSALWAEVASLSGLDGVAARAAIDAAMSADVRSQAKEKL